ncbi:MAG: hypothetical protein VKJ09_15580, partial [Leptolyngbya sp.]|nr:hypothetical protein [Leptolyngbya sp.]
QGPASERGSAKLKGGTEDQPGTADFEKRVMRFCNGKGFDAGPWPDWDTSSPGYIAKQFARLDSADREAAERWRDAYLRDLAARKKRPVPVGVFIRDRLWAGLDPQILVNARSIAERGASKGGHALPDDWAPAFGPVWMACRFEALLAGPREGAEVPESGFWLVSQIQRDWPRVHALHLSVATGGLKLPPHLHGLADDMEFVPTGTAVFDAWRDTFRARGWPLPDGRDGLYFPKGGPEGIDAFACALAALKQGHGSSAPPVSPKGLAGAHEDGTETQVPVSNERSEALKDGTNKGMPA